MFTNEQKEILAKVFDHGYVDDHGGTSTYRVDVEVGVGLWVRALDMNHTELIPLFKGTFCCNPFYISKEDGEVHLDTCSCGGTVIGGNIDRYNNEMSQNNLDGYHTIEHIIPITKDGYKRLKNRWDYIENHKKSNN